jgi:hypothetical protein
VEILEYHTILSKELINKSRKTATKEQKQQIIETRLSLVFNELKDKYDIQTYSLSL